MRHSDADTDDEHDEVAAAADPHLPEADLQTVGSNDRGSPRPSRGSGSQRSLSSSSSSGSDVSSRGRRRPRRRDSSPASLHAFGLTSRATTGGPMTSFAGPMAGVGGGIAGRGAGEALSSSSPDAKAHSPLSQHSEGKASPSVSPLPRFARTVAPKIILPAAKKEPYWFCDGNFLSHLVPKSVVYPMTRWKAGYFFLLAVACGLLAWTNQFVGYSGWFEWFFKVENTPLLVYTSSIDFILVAAATAWATYEPLETDHVAELRIARSRARSDDGQLSEATRVSMPAIASEAQTDQLTVDDLALVIPAYKCSKGIKEVLDHAFKHLKPEQIILVNNGDGELEDLKGYLQSLGGRYARVTVVDYNVGNKTYAQYIGARIAKLKGFKAVMSIDDDVLLHGKLNLSRDLSMMKGDTCAVTYGLEPIIDNPKSGRWGKFWIAMQKIEYYLSMQHKIFERRVMGSVSFAPGAIIMCRVDEFIDALKGTDKLPGVDARFAGEDAKLSLQLRYADKDIAISGQTVQTRAPDSFFKLWLQRMVWDKVFYVHAFSLVFTPLFKFRKDCRNAIPLKLIQLYMLHSVIANLIRVPMVATFAERESFWWRFGAYFGATLLPVVAWYFKVKHKRPDLKPSFISVLGFPIFKALSHVFALFAFLHTVFIHVPNPKEVKTIKEAEASGELDVLDLVEKQGIDVSRGVRIATRATALELSRPPHADRRRGQLFHPVAPRDAKMSPGSGALAGLSPLGGSATGSSIVNVSMGSLAGSLPGSVDEYAAVPGHRAAPARAVALHMSSSDDSLVTVDAEHEVAAEAHSHASSPAR